MTLQLLVYSSYFQMNVFTFTYIVVKDLTGVIIHTLLQLDLNMDS